MLDWLACTVVRAASGLLCRLSPSLAVRIGAGMGALAWWLQRERTHLGLRNVRAAFGGTLTPAEARRIIRACYRQLGAGMAELLRLPVIDQAYLKRFITIEGVRHFDEAIASGRPVIFLTGHYGNWELASIVAALRGHPIVALARAQARLPRLYRLLVSFRESKGCTVVHKGGAMRRLVAALEAGRPVGIVADQASRQGIPVPFFGRPALFATGPFGLAYGKDALLVPVFIRRVRGPIHAITVEPAMRLPRDLPKAEAVRQGIEWFAALLARHIQRDPSQWLWMHNRWKHTPARRALVLSDGKAGHVRQSLVVVEALRERRPDLTSQVLEVRYRNAAGRLLALVASIAAPDAARCLEYALTQDTHQALPGQPADVIISCGASTAPVNVLWSRATGARSVVIMNPAPIPLGRFSLVITPRHDGLPQRPHVVQTEGALIGPMPEARLAQATARLSAHAKFRPAPESAGEGARTGALHAHPIIAVFIGGDAARYEVRQAFVEAMVRQVQSACEAMDGWYLVTTSRRTAPDVERALAERIGRDPRCRLLLLASRDPLDGTMEGLLGSADVALVTGESISMVSEACTSGRRVIVVEPPLRAERGSPTKHHRFLEDLARARHLRLAPVPELGLAIRRALTDAQPPLRLENFEIVREALARVLP